MGEAVLKLLGLWYEPKGHPWHLPKSLWELVTGRRCYEVPGEHLSVLLMS